MCATNENKTWVDDDPRKTEAEKQMDAGTYVPTPGAERITRAEREMMDRESTIPNERQKCDHRVSESWLRKKLRSLWAVGSPRLVRFFSSVDGKCPEGVLAILWLITVLALVTASVMHSQALMAYGRRVEALEKLAASKTDTQIPQQ